MNFCFRQAKQVRPAAKPGVGILHLCLLSCIVKVMGCYECCSLPLQIPAEIWLSFPETSVFAQDVWEEVLFLLLHRQEQSLQS